MLGTALATMTENLRGLVGQINGASETMNGSTQDMATISRETGWAVEEVAVGVEVIRPGACAMAARGPARYFGGEEAAAERIVAG